MREKALLFGEERSLVGVVTEPSGSAAPRKRAVVILNAGVLHRVGPNRVHVLLARALAAVGFVVLRFDFSGIGDSRQGAGSESFARKVVREVDQAVDCLAESYGATEYLVLGICSGADHGLRVSSQNPRFKGAVLIDGFNLPSLPFVLHFYRKHLLSLRSWMRFIGGRSLTWSFLRSLAANDRPHRADLARAESVLPTRAEFVSQTLALADRGVELFLLYTGHSPAYYNYRTLLRRKLRNWPSRGRVRVEHMADSDHVFTLKHNQRQLIDLVCGWVKGVDDRA